MKNSFSLIVFCLCLNFFQPDLLSAQSSPGTIGARPNFRVDTIPENIGIVLDSNVIRFNATLISNGICMTRSVNGNALPQSFRGLKRGNIVIVDQVIAVNENGQEIRLPARKFVVN